MGGMKRMGIEFEKIAGEVIEEIRVKKKEAETLIITQEKLAEFIFSNQKDVLTPYQMVVGKKAKHRRLKLGELYDACECLQEDFIDIIVEVRRRLRERPPGDTMGGTKPHRVRKSKAADKNRKQQSHAFGL
jgi:NACalpha-BTF3-like transcription factor